MSALVLEIAPREAGSPIGPFAHRVLGGALAGHIVPAHIVGQAAAESRSLLDVEAVVPEVFATRFVGDAIGARVVAATPPTLAWCAVVTAMPLPGGAARPDAYLRFAIGLGTPRERLAPLVALRVLTDRLELRFGVHGAPYVAPAPRDHGGPVDRAWQRAREQAIADLGAALGRLDALAPAQLRLSGEGLEASEVAALARAWGAEPTEIEGRSLLVTPSLTPGKCRACRHANQGTTDLEEDGLLACAFAGARPLHADPSCDVVWTIDGKKWVAYEPFDGGNSTWGAGGEVRVRVPGAAPRAVPKRS